MKQKDVLIKIIESAKKKPCYMRYLNELSESLGEPVDCDNEWAVTPLDEALKAPMWNVRKEEWLSRSEVTLLILGHARANLASLYEGVMSECQKEIAAYTEAMKMFEAGAEPESVMDRIASILR